MFRRRLLLAAALFAAFVSTPHAPAQQTPAPDNTTPPSAPKPEATDIPVPRSAPKPEWTDISIPPSGTPAPPPSLPDLKFPNFTTCPISELEIQVPDVAHIRPAPDQSQLSPLLDKIAAKTVEIANQTPNLISHEEVISQNGPTRTKESFSYLVLQHSLRSGTLIFDEFRVDSATGEKFETEFSKPSAASTPKPPPSLADLSMPSAAKPESGPMSKGFVGAWLFFYPSNRRLLDFRYLGIQKLHHAEALVFSFAQKSGKTSFSGATVEFGGTNYQVSVQGLAWVDPADFRIVRLRTELLSVPGALPMRQLTSDIEFGQFPISDLRAPLWLPRHVTVAAILGGVASHEDHSYSNYRLFRAHTKIVPK